MCTKMVKTEQNFLLFRELVDRINLKYKDCKMLAGRNVSNDVESSFIEELVRLARGGGDVHKFLIYLEEKVPGVESRAWMVFCWAYADILHKEKDELPSRERYGKLKEFFSSCIQHHAKGLHDLQQIMGMIEHTGKMGPLGKAVVRKGSETSTLEEIIHAKTKTFSRSGKVLPISQIGHGYNRVKWSISDFYPKLGGVLDHVKQPISDFYPKLGGVPDHVKQPISDFYPKLGGVPDHVKQPISDFYPKLGGAPDHVKQSISHVPLDDGPLVVLEISMCDSIRDSSSLIKIPAYIEEMVGMPRFADAKDPSFPICKRLTQMCEKVGPLREPVLAIALLWVYVGVLDKRRRNYDPVKAVTGVDGRLGGLFKISVEKYKYGNSAHVINLWNAILELSPHMDGFFPITSALIHETYPNVDLNLPPDRVSYKPKSFYVPTGWKMLVPQAQDGKANILLPQVLRHNLGKGILGPRPDSRQPWVNPASLPSWRISPTSLRPGANPPTSLPSWATRPTSLPSWPNHPTLLPPVANFTTSMPPWRNANSILPRVNPTTPSPWVNPTSRSPRVNPSTMPQWVKPSSPPLPVPPAAGNVSPPLAKKHRVDKFDNPKPQGTGVLQVKDECQIIKEMVRKLRGVIELADLTGPSPKLERMADKDFENEMKYPQSSILLRESQIEESDRRNKPDVMGSDSQVKMDVNGSCPSEEPDMSGWDSREEPDMSGWDSREEPDMSGWDSREEPDMSGWDSREEPDMSGWDPRDEPEMNESDPRDEPEMNESDPRNEPDMSGSDSRDEPKMNEPDPLDEPDMSGSDPSVEPDISESDRIFDPEVLLFVTDPNTLIRLNPSLFPSKGGGWTASCLPNWGERNSDKKDDTPDPRPGLPTVPAGCTETLLGIDFTPEEYLEQTIADNYYAQGLKLVDGARRVVFYHRDNQSGAPC
ncbi:uncharacterized protein LOC118439206 [Folsomia candida]|uniref:uncharacterized protein LOC118439206 n=1 Tax=Folsomia candida TaxID=158441 RepID=UPI001604ADBF|nr:uncharacterized protein LOC118439206 [Folsomia candida]